jgi:hypothetical protein
MKNTVLIHTQYFENYNVGPEGFGAIPHWKPKGGHTFSIEMDTDILLYCDNAPAIFQKMLDGQASVAERFEYIEHEIQWQSPTVLGTQDDFVKHLQAIEA